jgi:seryl-tRNA synthetase
MIDIALIRENPEHVKSRMALLNDPAAVEKIDQIVALDVRRRRLLTDSESLQAVRNKLNKSVGMLRGNKKLDDAGKNAAAVAVLAAIDRQDYDGAVTLMSSTDAPATTQTNAVDTLMARLKSMGEQVEAYNDELKTVDAEFDRFMLWLPNLPHESTPVGMSDADNTPEPMQGTLRTFDFVPKPHWELGPALDIIDFERGVRIVGTRGYVLKGWGARLQRALISFFLDQARAKGFQELYVPYFVKEEMLYGSANLPKFGDTLYRDADADVYMLPTAEVSVTAMHRDEILDEAQLPIYYVAHTPCFRREKTSAGRDVRGIKRVHQFEKVEMYKFTTPETSYAELEALVEAACDICRALELPFRRLPIVSGDLGFAASKKYDVEVFAPGCDEWLEVSSCSNTEAFQARRSNIRYRSEGQKRTQFVHTLNGSGLATPRVVIAILENYQQADGSVLIPTALRPYLGGAERITVS